MLYNASVYRDDAGKVIGVFAAARDITERKKAEEAIRHASAYNRSLIEASIDPMVTIAPDGHITDINKATEAVTGYPREKLIGTDFSNYFTEPVKARKGYQTVFETGSVKDYPLEIRHRNGRITPVLYNASVYRDEAGAVIGVFAVARDITERKKAEEAIELANAYNRSLIEASLDPLVTIAPDGRITDVNRATEVVTGYPRERLIGTDFSNYFTEPTKAKEGYLTVFREGMVSDYPLEILHRDGHITPVIYNASLYKDENGRVIGVFAAARDITDRKRAEDAFKVASAYNRSLIEASLDPLVTISPDGKITDVNMATEAVTGFSRDRLIGMDFSDYFTEPAKARKGYMQVFEHGSVTDYPLEIRIGILSLSLLTAKLLDVNVATEAVTGFSRDLLIGTDFSDYFTEPAKARKVTCRCSSKAPSRITRWKSYTATVILLRSSTTLLCIKTRMAGSSVCLRQPGTSPNRRKPRMR